MSLPGLIVEPFGDQQTQRLADSLRVFVEDVKGRHVVDGVLLEDVSIGTGETIVAHKLGRKPFGAIPISQDADARIWHSTARDARNLYLTASAAVVTSLWVF